MNQLRLTASITAVQPLRYTPAGLPALDLELSHESTVEHNGQTRQVVMVAKALAIGALAETLQKQPIGSLWQFSGFLASSKSWPQPSRQLVFHILAVRAGSDEPSVSVH